MKRGMKILLFCISSLTLISWDRASKELAKEHLKDKAPLTYLNDTVRFQYAENTGAALSMGDSLPQAASFWLLGMLPLAIILLMAGYAIKHSGEMSNAKLVSFNLMVAGGLGNIYDRIVFDRHVTDFMNIGIGDLRTGIFNFADVCITAGAIFLLLSASKDKNLQSQSS
ncbi:MAG TPA: signal peptidase II [Ferruginibacter sp.]|nr:signal peptidase II [Ferruginibacter sp.]